MAAFPPIAVDGQPAINPQAPPKMKHGSVALVNHLVFFQIPWPSIGPCAPIRGLGCSAKKLCLELIIPWTHHAIHRKVGREAPRAPPESPQGSQSSVFNTKTRPNGQLAYRSTSGTPRPLPIGWLLWWVFEKICYPTPRASAPFKTLERFQMQLHLGKQ